MSDTGFAEPSPQPLNERERALLNRLLSDPSIYPQVFKSWLTPYMEGSDMVLPQSAVHGLTARLDALEARLTTLEGGP